MTPTEVAAFLRKYNVWRRGNLDDQPMPGPREIGESIDAAVKMIGRLEAAEEDRSNFIVEMGKLCAQCDALRLRIKAAEKERDAAELMSLALRAKIERMEKQEPVTWQTRTRPAWNDGTWGPWRKCSEEYAEDIKKTPLLHDWLYEARALYTLPGAQPAPSVPDDIVREVLRDCCGTFHGSRHRITCEKYKDKREPGDKP